MNILAIVNSDSLAHVTRPLEIARELRKRNHTIKFAGQGKYLQVAQEAGFETFNLPYISLETMIQAIRAGKLDQLYPYDVIDKIVESEIELYKILKPDFIITDGRLTANISSEYLKIPFATILNVQMCSQKKIPFKSIGNTWLGKTLPFLKKLDRIENAIESHFMDHHVMKGIARLRKKLGLKKKLGFQNEESPLMNLYPDIPQFNPTIGHSHNGLFVGPITWHNQFPTPKVLNAPDKSKKYVYFTIGSEGFEFLIEHLSQFKDSNLIFIVATGGAKIPTGTQIPDNVVLETYVNADRVLPHCELVVCHGGNGTIYQALSHGVPIVGIATHDEQFYGLKQVNNLKLGKGIHGKQLIKNDFEAITKMIFEVLDNPIYKKNARAFQLISKAYLGGALKAAAIIESLMSTHRSPWPHHESSKTLQQKQDDVLGVNFS